VEFPQNLTSVVARRAKPDEAIFLKDLLAIIKMEPKIIKVFPLQVNNNAELAGSQIGSPLIIN